jgi:hypothetical protein
MDNVERLESLRRAVSFYTRNLDLTLIKVHYPLYEPEWKVGDPEDALRGRCSCGKDYVVRAGVIDKDLSDDTNAGKHPVQTGWTHDESKQIKADSDPFLAWGVPWNIGIPVGPDFSLMIVDVDTRNGGMRTVSRLADESKYVFPRTFKDFSSGANGSRGYHLFYRITDPVIWNIVKDIRLPASLGIDLKGVREDVGQVVVAPSMHATWTTYELDMAEYAAVDGRIHDLTEEEARAMRDAFENVLPRDDSGRMMAIGAAGPMEQVKMWLAEGRVDTEWGPGNHDANMVSAIGALISLVPPAEDVHLVWADRMQRESNWVPAAYTLLVTAFDEAICVPRPYYTTEPAKIVRLIRTTLMEEMRKTTAAVEGLKKMTTNMRPTPAQRLKQRAAALERAGRDKAGK